jgi:hypothetical protein
MKLFVAGGLLLLMGGCSMTNSVVVNNRLTRVPHMTCEQLIRNGPPPDGFVTIMDLRACSKGFIAARYDFDLDLYVPAYPGRLAKEPDPPDLPFVLQVWSDDDRERLLGSPGPVEITCRAQKGARIVDVSRGPGEVEKWARDGIQQKYPGIPFANVLVLTFGHGSTPTAERARSAWRYGVAESLIGLAILTSGAVLAQRRKGIFRDCHVNYPS